MDDPTASSGSEAPPPYLGASQSPGISERMQALMSRAEQEIAEQRQLQALVGEVRQGLSSLQDEIRGVAGAHTLEIVRGEVTGLGSEVRTSTTMLGERLEAVVRAVGASAQVMQGVGQQLDRITELLNHQQQQIGTLSAAVAQHRETLAELGDLPDRVAERTASSVAEAAGSAEAAAAESAAGVREHLTERLREHVGDLQDRFQERHERLEEAVGEVRVDAAAAMNALGDRIDSAVIALAEALLRPRLAATPADADDGPVAAGAAGAVAPAPEPEPVEDREDAGEVGGQAWGEDGGEEDDEEDDDGVDAPTTATMTVPVVAGTPSPPWAATAQAATADVADGAEDAEDTPDSEDRQDGEPADDAGDADEGDADEAGEAEESVGSLDAGTSMGGVEEDVPDGERDEATTEEATDERPWVPGLIPDGGRTGATEATGSDDDTDDEADDEAESESDEVPLDGWPDDAAEPDTTNDTDAHSPEPAGDTGGADDADAEDAEDTDADDAEDADGTDRADAHEPSQPAPEATPTDGPAAHTASTAPKFWGWNTDVTDDEPTAEPPAPEPAQPEKRRPWWRPGG